MSKTRSFTDADGDTYTTQLGESGHNIVITYQNGDGGGTELFVFKVEDAARITNDILNTALEAGK
jgi:hypothetical protein